MIIAVLRWKYFLAADPIWEISSLPIKTTITLLLRSRGFEKKAEIIAKDK